MNNLKKDLRNFPYPLGMIHESVFILQKLYYEGDRTQLHEDKMLKIEELAWDALDKIQEIGKILISIQKEDKNHD